MGKERDRKGKGCGREGILKERNRECEPSVREEIKHWRIGRAAKRRI